MSLEENGNMATTTGDVTGKEVDDENTASNTLLHLAEHSNANLLKIDTKDSYSTSSAIKKYISKMMPPPATGTPPAPLLPGLIRLGKNPKNPHIFMAFETAAERDAASELLTTKMTYRKAPWTVSEVTERDMQLTHKGAGQAASGKQDEAAEADAARKRPREGADDAPAQQQEVMGVNVWAAVPYDEQVRRKEHHCRSILKTIVPNEQQKTYADKFACLKALFERVYSVEGRSDTGYRNNTTLTFGLDRQGRTALGFLEGAMVDGRWNIDPLSERNVTSPAVVRVVADAVMAVVKSFSGSASVFDKTSQKGFWRRMQVRHNIHFELMLDLELDESAVDAATLAEILAALIAAVASTEARAVIIAAAGVNSAGVVSLQYHHATGIAANGVDPTRKVIFGQDVLTETLCGCKFDLSPTAFFQVNTPGMELMMSHVLRVANLRSSTTLLDLCCGTGTIGICLGRHVRKIVGIELVDDAVKNARVNATRNNVANATYHSGRVEQLLPDVVHSFSADDRKDVVAILDPPRAGVNTTVLKWIRSTPSITRLVYISCDQRALQQDCPALTKAATNQYRGEPFKIVTSFGVDMFPHTPHVEMIVVLQRGDESAPCAVPGTNPTSSSNAPGSS